jgi:hypothetical protein
VDGTRALGVFAAAVTCLAIAAVVPVRRGGRIEDRAPGAVEPGRFAQGVIEEIVGELRRRDARDGGADGAQLDAMLRDLGVPVPRNGTPSGASDRSLAQSIQSSAGAEVNRRMPQLLTSLARLKSGRLPRRRPAPVASRPAPSSVEPSRQTSAVAAPLTQAAVPFGGGGGGGIFLPAPVITPSATPAVPPSAPPSSPPDDAAQPAVPAVPPDTF